MKKLKFLSAIMFSMLLFPLATNAEQELTQEQIEQLTVVETKYIKTITSYDNNGEVIGSADFELTKEEYDNDIVTPEEYTYMRTFGLTRTNDATHETNAKVLTLKVEPTRGSTNWKGVTVNVHWKTVPNVKKFDIIGFAIITGSTQTTPLDYEYYVNQVYDGNTITYDKNSGNRVDYSNGHALVMNIVDSTSQSLDITYFTELFGDAYNLKINASYQHATSTTITADEAKNVTFGNSTSSSSKEVLGSTFIYNSSIANKYDHMAGVSVLYDISNVIG